ncbi:unnamed protein product, partial [Prorocentrum cordatum]
AKCDCKFSILLDEKGNYNLEKVRAHDGKWGSQCEGGLEWEILSWGMDEEEPEAALVISIALNKKNETAMKTGHLEILSTLVGLCKPDPHGCVPFEPVRGKLIDLYGAEIDHPDFLRLFKLVRDAGGEGSIHMKDLFSFTGVFVNPKVRKMRMEAYGVIAPYPEEFPKLKNACLKFNKESRFQMYDFLKEVEGAFLQLGPTSEKLRCKWIAEVEDCSSFIATKLRELMSLGKAGLTKADMPQFPRETDLMQEVGELRDDPNDKGQSPSPGPKGKSSVVTETLTPRVIKQDAEGGALTAHETASAAVGVASGDKVDTIPWREWARSACASDDKQIAKQVLALAMSANHDHVTCEIPIAMIKSGSAVKAVATRDIPVGHLKVPLWFKKDASMVMEGPGVFIHPKAACAEVSWVKTITEAEEEVGVESGEEVVVRIHVQPELRLPKEGGAGFVWDPRGSVHPFWFIKRSDHKGNAVTDHHCEANASVVMETVKQVWASDYVHLKTAEAEVAPMASTYSVKLPCIVSKAPIKAGQE